MSNLINVFLLTWYSYAIFPYGSHMENIPEEGEEGVVREIVGEEYLRCTCCRPEYAS